MYKLSIVIFLFSLLVDTGDIRIVGIPVPMLTLLGMTLIGLHNWSPVKDKIVWTVAGLILLWVICQWIVWDYYLDGFRMIFLLFASLVIGGQGDNFNDIKFQLHIALLIMLVVGACYYLGFFWHPVPTGNSFGKFNPNSIALMLDAGIIIGFGFILTEKGYYQKLAGIGILFLPWVVWNTGSRKAVLLMLLCLVLYVFFRIKKKKTMLIIIFALLIIISPGLKKYYFTTAENETNFITKIFKKSDIFQKRYTFKLYGSTNFRMMLIKRGWTVVKKEPWLGYGIGAPSSAEWLESNIGIASNAGRYVMVHNGFIDYLLMGGVPVFVVFMVLFGRVSWRLVKLIYHENKQVREYALIVLMLNLLFWYNIFFGDYSWKMGWWILGCGLLVIKVEERERQPVHSNSAGLKEGGQ